VRHSVLKRRKPRSSLLVHTCGHEITGLKTYRGPKRKEQFGVCSLRGYYVPEAAVKQGKTDLEGRNFRLAGWIAERHIKGTGFSRSA
jgi:hypothetical protein